MKESGQTSCRRCGRCCRQGGPALHHADLGLLRDGWLLWSQLITIRRGEPVHNPISGTIQPAGVELVKIAGKTGSWKCLFLSPEGGCTIYLNRPLACRRLKCWDTREILQLVEKDTLDRQTIVAADQAMQARIADHQRLCPADDLALVLQGEAAVGAALRLRLARLAEEDLRFRAELIAESGLSRGEELFLFGRPLFQLLQQLGVGVSESPGGIRLHWPQPPARP